MGEGEQMEREGNHGSEKARNGVVGRGVKWRGGWVWGRF